jgi:hypothetical protein
MRAKSRTLSALLILGIVILVLVGLMFIGESFLSPSTALGILIGGMAGILGMHQ